MCVVAFDYAKFAVLYPEFFPKVNELRAFAYFDQAAALYLDNTDQSAVQDCNERAQLFFLLVAHICALNVGTNGADAAALVGRIEQAQEGSVMVKTATSAMPGTSEWFTQTKYGAAYWQATSPYRAFQYYPGRSRPARGYGSWSR